MENKKIVGIGEVLWDMLPDGKKLGGAPANFAYNTRQFGLDSIAVSAIGNDALGIEILSVLDDKKVSGNIERVPYPTGTVEVQLDGDGIPQYQIKENVAWDNIPSTSALTALAANTEAVCFGSLAQRNVVSRQTIYNFLDAMTVDDRTLIVFDINLRQNFYTREVIEESLRRCTVLKINDEELVIVSRIFEIPGIDLREKCRMILERYNLKILILTCGVNGSYVFAADTESFLPTPRVEVADTVGAGDSFTAAFIASILKGNSIERAHMIAVETSAYVCTQHGAMPRLPKSLIEKSDMHL